MKELKGAGVALITPFKENGDVDHIGLAKLIKHQSEGGTDFLVVMGTTGESATISPAEKEAIIATIKEANTNNLPLVLGIGGNCTSTVCDLVKNTNLDGFCAVLSVSPYYNKPNQEGIIKHYTAVADASPLPIILYNVPGRTGSNLTAETTLKLANHPNIVATKEASANWEQVMEIIQHRPEGFLVLSGDDNYTMPFISLGMDGVISVICNAYPKEFSTMVHAALKNDFDNARSEHYKLVDSMNLIFADGNPGGIKVVLNEMGICDNEVRLPLSPVNKEVEDALRKVTKNF